MKISSTQQKPGGFALISLMACLVVILVVFSGVMYWVSSNAKQMRENEVYTSSEAAAEGASEAIFSHMDQDYLYANLNSASNYQSDVPSGSGWPVQYTYSVTVTINNNGSTNSGTLQYLNSQYTNLLGEPVTNTVTVTATPSGQLYNVPATVSQNFIFATIPAFQFAIFYNINMEVDPGAQLPIIGAVFSNAGIWSGTANVLYSNTVEAVGQVTTNGTDPFCSGKSDNGTPHSSFKYSGTPPQPESNVNPLVIPIGASATGTNDSTNVQAIVEIPPASVCAPKNLAYVSTNQVYDFNAASLIVSNWYWGTNGVKPWSNNFTAYAQDTLLNPTAFINNGIKTNWIQLTNDYYIISNRDGLTGTLWPTSANPTPTNWIPNFQFTNNWSAITWTNWNATNGPIGTNSVWYAGFSFLTNVSYYDYREQATVQAVQLDVGKLGAWITNCAPNGGSNWNYELCEDQSHGFNSIYIDNTVPQVGQKLLPAVRVVNGQLLPYSKCIINSFPYFTCGLTVATPNPIYVLGMYNVQTNGGPVVTASHNTANTFPAAFLADSITILSSSWKDANTSSTALSSRTPVATTINAACLEGIVPSVGSSYSGGVENFLRLEENWGNGTVTLTYNGSIMVMYASQYATNVWPNTGSVYNPPARDWAFDTNFLIEADLPALTPNFRAVIRNSWTSY